MEQITTQSGIVSGKKDLQIQGRAEEVILTESKQNRGLIQKFKAFCERQQENRLGWTAIIVAGQVLLLAPLTLLAIYSNGNLFALWIPVIFSCFTTVVSNLLALPTKITIPVFCASILINVSAIMLSFML